MQWHCTHRTDMDERGCDACKIDWIGVEEGAANIV
jgi:hypothetical protein